MITEVVPMNDPSEAIIPSSLLLNPVLSRPGRPVAYSTPQPPLCHSFGGIGHFQILRTTLQSFFLWQQHDVFFKNENFSSRLDF